ncbi:MAG: glutamate 5-kinase [Lentisphaerae bacterium]|nr:glutamate 5-kinase [Lentisphaerota bacterium]
MHYQFEDNGTRANLLPGIHRVVVKVGTRLLMDVDGQSAAERVNQLVAAIAGLRDKGLEVVLVSSGAIGAGMELLGTKRRPKSLAALQAHAAVGQSLLMTLYEEACKAHGFHCGQLLLTAADLHDQERHRCVAQCLNELLARQVLPVINENDSVCVDEIKVGDNDTLAALVAGMSRADLTILLTTINGLCERLPDSGKLGSRISVVTALDSEVIAMAQGTDGNRFSVGGMVTKLRAAAMVTRSGEPLWIADGFDFGVLSKLFAGEDLGTLFVPSRKVRMHAKQRFLAFFSEPRGALIVDAGAEAALCKNGRSLLPGGVIGLRGVFKAGDTVRIITTQNQELGRGVVNFSNAELSLLCGARTGEIPQLLGYQPDMEEAVHRDSFVLTC